LKLRSCALLAACATLWLSACPSRTQVDAATAAGLIVTDTWARATPTAAIGAAYFTIANHTAEADTLLSVATPLAAQAELHRTITAAGMARMRPAGEVIVPAGHTLKAEPGGLHVMLYELVRPLAAGEAIPLTLTFARAGAVTVMLEVRAATSGALQAHARY
jgi:copper(I)-binding protein